MHTTIRQLLLRILPPPILRAMHAARLRSNISAFTPKIVEHRYAGVPLKVHLRDSIGQGWYDYEWEDVPEFEYLREHLLGAGDRVFFLGAHQGVVPALYATQVGPTGQVIAVEAGAHNFSVLEANAQLNNLSQLEPLHAAVSDISGDIQFIEGFNGRIKADSDQIGYTVRSLTIDELHSLYGPPTLVVIDIEGAECLALRSASAVLATEAHFAIEVHVNEGLELLGGSVATLLSYFPVDRYELYAREDEEPNLRAFDPSSEIVNHRFHLLAIARAASKSEAKAT